MSTYVRMYSFSTEWSWNSAEVFGTHIWTFEGVEDAKATSKSSNALWNIGMYTMYVYEHYVEFEYFDIYVCTYV